MSATTIDPSLLDKARLDAADLARITLDKGNHPTRGDGLCVMEAAAWRAGQLHTDAPPCVAPSIRRFLIKLNDRAPAGPRQRLLEVIDDVLGSASRGSERTRAFSLADWAARVVVPLAADMARQPEVATSLRALPEIVDNATARGAREACRAARARLRAAAYAADAAAAAAAAADADDDDDAAYAAYAADAAVAAVAAAYAAAARQKAHEEMWAKLMDQAIPLIRKMAA